MGDSAEEGGGDRRRWRQVDTTNGTMNQCVSEYTGAPPVAISGRASAAETTPPPPPTTNDDLGTFGGASAHPTMHPPSTTAMQSGTTMPGMQGIVSGIPTSPSPATQVILDFGSLEMMSSSTFMGGSGGVIGVATGVAMGVEMGAETGAGAWDSMESMPLASAAAASVPPAGGYSDEFLRGGIGHTQRGGWRKSGAPPLSHLSSRAPKSKRAKDGAGSNNTGSTAGKRKSIAGAMGPLRGHDTKGGDKEGGGESKGGAHMGGMALDEFGGGEGVGAVVTVSGRGSPGGGQRRCGGVSNNGRSASLVVAAPRSPSPSPSSSSSSSLPSSSSSSFSMRRGSGGGGQETRHGDGAATRLA